MRCRTAIIIMLGLLAFGIPGSSEARWRVQPIKKIKQWRSNAAQAFRGMRLKRQQYRQMRRDLQAGLRKWKAVARGEQATLGAVSPQTQKSLDAHRRTLREMGSARRCKVFGYCAVGAGIALTPFVIAITGPFSTPALGVVPVIPIAVGGMSLDQAWTDEARTAMRAQKLGVTVGPDLMRFAQRQLKR